MADVPNQLHQLWISSFRDFVRTNCEAHGQTLPKTIPARNIAGAQVSRKINRLPALLSGDVQLYVPSRNEPNFLGQKF